MVLIISNIKIRLQLFLGVIWGVGHEGEVPLPQKKYIERENFSF